MDQRTERQSDGLREAGLNISDEPATAA